MDPKEQESIIKLEHSHLTKKHKELFKPSTEDAIVSSKFSAEFERSTFYNISTIEMSAVAIENNNSGIVKGTSGNLKVDYYIPEFVDFLTSSYMILQLPKIEVVKEKRKQVRIAWCHNFGHHIIDAASLTSKYGTIQTIYPESLDAMVQGKVKDRKGYRKEIGNIPQLTEFKTCLLPRKLCVPQAWYYGGDSGLGIPILKRKGMELKHVYVYKNIVDALRFQVLNDKTGQYQNVSPTRATKIKLLEGGGDLQFPIPKLFGRFITVTDEERMVHLEREFISYDIDDIQKIIQPNHSIMGQTVELDFDTEQLCSLMYIMAKNLEDEAYSEHASYCINMGDEKIDPIKLIGINYGTRQKQPPMDSIHFSKSEFYGAFGVFPDEIGYYMKLFESNPSIEGKCGVPFTKNSKVKVSCTLRTHDGEEQDNTDKDIVVNLLKSKNDNNTEKQHNDTQKFRIILLLNIIRTIIFKSGGEIEIK